MQIGSRQFNKASVLLFALVAVSGGGCSNLNSGEVCDERNAAHRIIEPYSIEITGDKYRWHVRYSGADGKLLTADDIATHRDVHVPVDTDIQLILKSSDFVYSLALPEFQIREIAVPNLEFRLTFRPTVVGQFGLLGDEFCGDPHPELTGVVVVEPLNQFLRWLAKQESSSRPDS